MSILMTIFYHGGVQPHNRKRNYTQKYSFQNGKNCLLPKAKRGPFWGAKSPFSGLLPGWCMNQIFLIRNTPPSCIRRDFCLKMSLRVYLADSFFSLCSQFLKLGVSREIISIQMHHLPSGRAILTGKLRGWCILRKLISSDTPEGSSAGLFPSI